MILGLTIETDTLTTTFTMDCFSVQSRETERRCKTSCEIVGSNEPSNADRTMAGASSAHRSPSFTVTRYKSSSSGNSQLILDRTGIQQVLPVEATGKYTQLGWIQ